MATFTLSLGELITLTGGKIEQANGRTKLVGGNVGLAHYPIFNDSYRDTLTGNIVDHFYTQEIGQETPDLFQGFMRRRMNMIMPMYNELYKTTLLELDPMITTRMKTVGKGKSEQKVNSTSDATNVSTSQSNARAVSSETPQTMLSDDGDYATAASDSNSGSTASSDAVDVSNTDSETEDERESETVGFQGIPADLIMAHRSAIINVDQMICNELQDLFMGILMNGDSYYGGN